MYNWRQGEGLEHLSVSPLKWTFSLILKFFLMQSCPLPVKLLDNKKMFRLSTYFLKKISCCISQANNGFAPNDSWDIIVRFFRRCFCSLRAPCLSGWRVERRGQRLGIFALECSEGWRGAGGVSRGSGSPLENLEEVAEEVCPEAGDLCLCDWASERGGPRGVSRGSCTWL